VVVLRHADARIPDHGVLPPRLSWDHATPGPKGSIFEHDLAFITCDGEHTLRLTARVHAIADDGVVSPSWVCTHPECSFHAFIRLEGWSARPA